VAAIVAVASLTAGVSHAQFQQYIAPGSLGIKEVPTKERLEAAMKDASSHLGPVRVGTVFGLNNIAYMNNVYGTATDQVSDVSATLMAGLQGYLPAGRKLVLGAYVLPQYTWWHRLSFLRTWGGQAGVGLFGYFNRVRIELQGSNSLAPQYYSSETLVPVNTRDQRGSATLEVRVLGRLSAFATGSQDRWRYENQPPGGIPGNEFSVSDRNVSQMGGGLRYRFRENVMIGLGYGTVKTDFLHQIENRSNSGNGAFVELQASGKHFWAGGSVSFASLRAVGGSSFVPYDGSAGHIQAGWQPSGNLQLQLYGGRYISYTSAAPAPYYIDRRLGVGVQGSLGWRTTARVFRESGRDDFAQGAVEARRTDDFNSIGVTFDFKIGRRSGVTVGWSRTDYTSQVPGASRSIPMFQLSLRFAGSGVGWW
jgi:hypothetical protein